MTTEREKIIQLAEECGVWLDDNINMSHHTPSLEAFYKAARAEAHEEDAKLMDARYAECYEPEIREAAAAIRERAKEMK